MRLLAIMAELVITDEERDAASYLSWSDEAIGKACKQVAEILRDGSGELSLKATGASVFLIAVCDAVKSDRSVLECRGAFQGEKEFGDWRITVERIDG